MFLEENKTSLINTISITLRFTIHVEYQRHRSQNQTQVFNFKRDKQSDFTIN